ncbi:glycerophosphodiester phosphodiesterase GDPDL7-like [Impatiens glandulifera]|uniref:glycerophosphodiester phosphodiesterase GDPDL7-like n=1 Tax=Impatiens glandulifera TaxID=253017 RepID=UPI001FB11DFE|nr:glycerophosphodiester phosphodiesterase GDPDL7-like [Impatiens glandulifera]
MTPRVPGPLIISHNGASGVYAPCTDLAYQQAITDGADIIDCSVQLSKDGVAFCLDSADLTGQTTALATFMQRSTTIPEIQKANGIFTFDLTWSEIQTLKPQLTSPYAESQLSRNPAEKNKGSFMTLSAFLDIAKTKAVKGVLIKILNAAFLVSKRTLSITDAVSAALNNVTFDKQRVLIQSDDSQVLAKYKSNTNYEKVLLIMDMISSAPKATVDEIKKYANAVTVYRTSIVKMTDSFAASITSVVDDLHAANITVYACLFKNEYVAIAFDYFSDPMVELATYIVGVGVDGIFTDFPATANAFLRSPCANPDNEPYSILPAQPGSLLQLTQPGILPPSEAPAPPLTVADIVDPPLAALPATGAGSGSHSSSGHRKLISSLLSIAAFICLFSLRVLE